MMLFSLSLFHEVAFAENSTPVHDKKITHMTHEMLVLGSKLSLELELGLVCVLSLWGDDGNTMDFFFRHGKTLLTPTLMWRMLLATRIQICEWSCVTCLSWFRVFRV